MEEPITTEPAVEPVSEPASAEPSEFSWETWHQGLPEELRAEKSLESFKHAKDKDELTSLLARSFVSTKKMVGKDKITVPNERSSPEEWDAYFKAGGRPDTAEDYRLATPEGFPEEIAVQVFPEGRLAKWQDLFFKSGLSKKAVDTFITEYAKDQIADYQRIQQEKETAKLELISKLSTEYGAAYQQKLHLGDMAIEDFAGDNQELKESLAYLRDDPNAVRMIVHFGEMLAEGKPPSYSAIPTPGDYQDQIDKLMSDPLYTKGTQTQRMRIAEKIMAIRKLQKPETASTR